MEWTLASSDANAARAGWFMMDDLGMTPIGIVDMLEKLTSIDMKIDDGFVVFVHQPTVFFPRAVVGHETTTLSLPVLMFNVLWPHPVNYCYITSRLAELRFKSTTMVQKAMFVVGEWMSAAVCNPPLVDSAMMVGRPDLRILVSLFAYRLRLVRPSLVGANSAIRDIMNTPWCMHIIDPFWRDLKRVFSGAAIYTRPIELDLSTRRAAINKPGTFQLPDFILEDWVGIVCCPSDKLVATAVLFFAPEFAYVKRAKKDCDAFTKERNVPSNLIPLLKLFVKLECQPIKSPSYHVNRPNTAQA